MRCDEVRAGLEARLDDELTADAARAFDAHVAGCAACAARVAARREEKERWRAALRGAAGRRAPGHLRARILAGPAAAAGRPRRVRRLWPAALAAAAAVVALMLLARGDDGPTGPAPFTRTGDIVAHDVRPAPDRTLVLSGKLL